MINYRMPAEWEQHRATWIAWPHMESDYPDKLDAVRWAYCEFIRHACRVERINILCLNQELENDLLIRLKRQRIEGDIVIKRAPYNRAWLRDSGPIGVHDMRTNSLKWIQFMFTGWGWLTDVEFDQKVPSYIAHSSERELITPNHKGAPVVLEGGMLDVNGAGLIMVTEECLLSETKQRNPGFGKNDYESIFTANLGATETLWLPWGVAGDDTHGHIDNVARFIKPLTVVVSTSDQSDAEQHRKLRENLEYLQAYKTANGEKLEVIELPLPQSRYCDGRLAAGYANFYFLNELLLVPTYNDPHDRIALGLLAEALPERKVVGIYSGDWVLGGGTLHCSTQQEPL